jgi:hypothetical protein
MFFNMNNLFNSNRGFDLDFVLGEALVGDPVIFPDNISTITWTMLIPNGVKAKLQATSFSEAKITVPATNLDGYWIDFDMSDDPVQDGNGFVTGPITLQGAISVVSGMRIVREVATPVEIEVGLRGQ